MDFLLKKNEFIRLISDLHLTSDPNRLNTFYAFIDQLPLNCKALFILGDFFDHWLGADIHTNDYHELQSKLNNVKCPIFFLPGNRDFLVEDSWLTNANLKTITDPTIIHVNHKKILLTHGDQLCTFDKGYQFYRTITRNKFSQFIFKCLPKPLRRYIFKHIRNQKKICGHVKKYAINAHSVDALCKSYQVNIMIHGHIHKPGIHITETIKRIVLDEWMSDNSQKHDTSYLDINNNHFLLQQVHL